MNPAARVKLSDVAARAGVSVATVSKVVNGRYGVSKDTIDLVQGVIDELMEQPMLASVLEAGLAAFDLSCDGVGDLS